MTIHKFKLILQEKISLCDNTQHFRFALEGVQPFVFKAGQFISLHIDKDGKEQRRNYSIANPPGNDQCLELAMTYLPNGLASTLLAGLKIGEAVNASGPYGQFILKDPEPPTRYLLIGTGTGITPYRSMLPDLAALLAKNNLKVVILEGVRSRDHLLYGDDFVDFASRHPQATFKACYSREYPAQPRDYELSGYVQNHLEDLNINPEGDIAYLCGNPNMVDEAFHKLIDLGLDRNRIRREKYLSSK